MIFLVVLVNILLVVIFTRPFKNYHGKSGIVFTGLFLVAFIIFIWILPGVFGYSKQEATGGTKRINFAIIQTAQPSKLISSSQETLASLEEQLKLLKQVSVEHPESRLVVFPETSELFKNISLFMTSTQAKNFFNNLFEEPALIVAGGRVFDADGQFYSRVFNLDTQDDILNFYDKRLLTPGGEFFPYPIKLIAWLFSKTTISQFNNLRELSAGNKDVSTVNFRGQFSAAPMICSELLSPGLTTKTSQNSDVIISMASYGVFHGNSVIIKQMLAATRFRAAETAKPVITAANLGQSYVINGRGDVVFVAPDSSPQILTGTVAVNPKKTWYNRVGDLPIILVSLLSVMSLNILIWFREFRRP